jgi:hypothetical protein
MKKEMTSHLSPEVNVDVSLFVSTCPFGLPRSGGEKSIAGLPVLFFCMQRCCKPQIVKTTSMRY